MQIAQNTLPITSGVRSTSTIMQSLMAIAFGVFMVGMVGFSHIDAVHNAAHDVRHSNAFPCH